MDLPEGFLTDHQPKIQQREVKTMLMETGKAVIILLIYTRMPYLFP